jgi:hypothetical protein
MNYRVLLIEIFAILASYLIMAMPLAYATNVNIIFNGKVQDTVEISPKSSVNKQISIQHDPSDRSWTRVKVLIKVNSASLAHNIERVYVYKCRALSPKDCARSTPLDFETYVDTELAWNDISARKGLAPWPEAANIIILVKLTDINDRVSWVGFWDTIERVDYNIFSLYGSELGSVDFYAQSSDLIGPIKNFIESYQMLPFNWASKVVFKTASTLYGLGGSEAELDQSPQPFQVAEISKNEVTLIGNEFQFIFPNTTNGVRSPITLNLNPSFTCGNNIHEADLGETSSNCCLDAGCPEGSYCDIADISAPASGACKDEGSISIEILPVSVPAITACTNQQTIDIKAKVNNPPSGLAATATGYITIGETIYTTSCTGEGNIYACPVTFMPPASCGKGSYSMGPNTITLTVSYNNGQQTVTRDMEKGFGDIVISYDCSCPAGSYCDIGYLACKPEAVSLSILDVTSYITNYGGGTDHITVKARINNPPTGMSISSITYKLGNITFDHSSVSGMSGTVTCSEGENSLYTCSIPFSISGYDHEKQHVIRDNSLTFSVSYPDGSEGSIKTKDIEARFSDVTIPSYRCGDGVVNPEETPENCCADAGCGSDNDYCDVEKGCQPKDGVTLSIVSLNPETFHDCEVFHTLGIKARANNIPTESNMVYYAYLKGGETQNWQLTCEQPNPVTGIFNCQLTIPPIEGCKLPYYTLGPNQLSIQIAFNDGSQNSPFFSQITKDLTASFGDIKIVPIYHCGDGRCESGFGEKAGNCCIDCPCKDSSSFGSEYYCDYDPTYSMNGTCLLKRSIELEILSPKRTVYFETCEISNKVSIEARIKNPPSGLIPENVYGRLNGTNAERIHCREKMTGTNSTYNCTITVPRIYDCTQGKTYRYSNNSISFFVSYYDGLGRRATQTLEASLPDVETRQGIRTIYQIMQATRIKLEAEFEGIQDILDRAVDYAESCVDMYKLVIFATLAMVVSGFIFKTPTIFEKVPGWVPFIGGEGLVEKSSRASAIQTGVILGALFLQAVKLYCDAMQTLINVQLRLRNINMKEIMIQQCIEMHQHDLDSGRCRDRELSCYTQMQNCLNQISGIESEINQIQSDMDRLGDQVSSFNNQVIKTVRELDYVGGHAVLNVRCDGPATDPQSCCQHAGVGIPERKDLQGNIIQERQCKPGRLEVVAGDVKNCVRPMIVLAGSSRPLIRSTRFTKTDIGTLGFEHENRYTFEIYCDNNNNGIAEEKEKLDEPNARYTIIYLKDRDDDCYCSEGEVPSYVQTIDGRTHEAEEASQSGAAAGTGGNQPPTASITSPSDGATVSGTFSVMWEMSDNDGDALSYIVSLKTRDPFSGTTSILIPILCEGQNIQPAISHFCSFDTTTVDDGDYVITLFISDGKEEDIESVYFTVNNSGSNGGEIGTPVSPSTCTYNGVQYECLAPEACTATGGTQHAGYCPQFPSTSTSPKYYKKVEGTWRKYDTQVEGSIDGVFIQCCVTGQSAVYDDYKNCMESTCIIAYGYGAGVHEASDDFSSAFGDFTLHFCFAGYLETWNGLTDEQRQEYVNTLGEYCCGNAGGSWSIDQGAGQCS